MNCTNYCTTEKIVYIINLVVSILQFLVTVIGLVYVNRFIRNKDRKEKERDKIADIIDKVSNKIVENGIDEDLRKLKEKFGNMVMFHGSGETKITGLEVLRFMLLFPQNFKSEPLTKLQQHLKAVVKLFRSLRIKLPLKGHCPKNIKEELGPLITGIGEVARSFVPAKDRYTITNVLKYFGNVQEVNSEENEKKKDEEHSKRIRRFVPYVDALRLGKPEVDLQNLTTLSLCDDQDFSFDIYRLPDTERNDLTTDLKLIESQLRNDKTIKTGDVGNFNNQIHTIWMRIFQSQDTEIHMRLDWSKEDHVCSNVLHAVRVFMFKAASNDSDILNDEGLKNLAREMKNKLTNAQHIKACITGKIQHIQRHIHWLNDESQLKSVDDNLKKVTESII